MRCIDEEFKLFGDYNSESASNFQLYFEKCNNNDKCKSEAEITSFLRRKFIFTVQNQNLFQTDDYSPDKVTETAKLAWFPINSEMRGEYINEIKMSYLEL